MRCNAGVGTSESVVVINTGHDYMGGTRGSGIVFNATDVLGMSVVRGIKEAGAVCEICVCVGPGRCRR